MAFNRKKQAHDGSGSEMLRRFKTSPFIFIGTFIVLVIVIVAFVLVPAIVPEYGRGSSVDLTFGYYDKVPISYVPGNFFAQYYEMLARYMQNTTDSENFSLMGYEIWYEAFKAATIHTAMIQEMKKSGYTAPVNVVDRDVAKLPQFQENGRFSPALYRLLDDTQRLTLWRQVQDDITKEHFRSDVTGMLKPAAEAAFISKMASLQRSFGMAIFSVDAYPDSEYEKYAEEHSDLFRSAHLSMITIGSGEREAQKLLASIKDGEITFEDAARANSKDGYADRGGDMGMKMIHELNIDIADDAVLEKALAIARGEYSDVLKTSSGWSFFRAEEVVQEANLSDSAVLEKVHIYVQNFERGRMEDWAMAQADDFRELVNELGFEKALSQRDMENHSFGPVPLNYGDVDLFTTLSSQPVAEISGSATNDNFWKTAFATPVNVPSQPIVHGSNVLVLFPTEETEIDEDAIESIKTSYDSYWLDYVSEQSIQKYFMNSPKMEDKFIDIYIRYFMNQG